MVERINIQIKEDIIKTLNNYKNFNKKEKILYSGNQLIDELLLIFGDDNFYLNSRKTLSSQNAWNYDFQQIKEDFDEWSKDLIVFSNKSNMASSFGEYLIYKYYLES